MFFFTNVNVPVGSLFILPSFTYITLVFWSLYLSSNEYIVLSNKYGLTLSVS